MHWSDGGAQSHSIVTPATATTSTANFSTQYLLTMKASPAGYGTVTASPASSDGYYNLGTQVQISATASAGDEFSSFSGNLTGTPDPQTLAMSAPASVTANFVPVPRFRVTMGHSRAFTKGENNALYSILVSDISSTATSGAITVSEALPAGMTLVSMAGAGWTCVAGGHTCTRSDSLSGGRSYPVVTVTVDIAASAQSPLVISVTVSGGGAASVTETTSVAIRE
jgi:hypothetical protein